MESVSFKRASFFSEIAANVFQEQRKRLLNHLPFVEVHHVGSTAIPGSITKGDLDANVRVKQQEFTKAVELLEAMYSINQPNNWTATFASFKDDSVGMEFGVQLTTIGSPEDTFLVQRDILLSHPELVEQLNMLKMKYEGKFASMSLAGNVGANPSQPLGSSPISESGAKVFPLLPLRGLVTFPHVSYLIFVGRPKSIRAVDHAIDRKVAIVLAAQRDARSENPSISDIYQVGTLAKAIQLVGLPDGTIKTIVETTARARVSRFVFEDFSRAEALEIEEPAISDPRIESLVPSVISALIGKRAKTFGEENPEGWAVAATTADGASMLADRIGLIRVLEFALFLLPSPLAFWSALFRRNARICFGAANFWS